MASISLNEHYVHNVIFPEETIFRRDRLATKSSMSIARRKFPFFSRCLNPVAKPLDRPNNWGSSRDYGRGKKKFDFLPIQSSLIENDI